MALRVRVVDGPGIPRAESWLREACAAWASPLGIAVEVAVAGDEAALAELVAEGRGADGLVVNAGALADSVPVARALAGSGVPSVAVDIAAATSSDIGAVAGAATDVIRGRGIDGYRWALRHLAARAAWPLRTLPYGDGREQVGDLRLPEAPPPHPVVALLHGGGWKEHWTRDLMGDIAVDLAGRGYATWNVEFRRVGPSGGGWPATFEDVAAGLDALVGLAEAHELDLSRTAVVGHSSGGQLALWAASRRPDDPGGPPAFRPALLVPLAPVTDLAESSRRGLIGGDDIAARLLGGGPEAVPERYAVASPLERLPLGVPQLLVQGGRDYLTDLRDLVRAYAEQARALGDDVELLELPAVEHLELIDAAADAWRTVAGRLGTRLRAPAPGTILSAP